MTNIIIDNLSKTFSGNVRALRDFSLTVGESELVAIVGPSGCGKSTLLRIIAGLEEESAGTVKLGDTVLNGLSPRKRDIAVVFQSYTLMPHLTVSENLGFGLKLRGEGKSSREIKTHETAKLLGIENLLQRHPAEISGGERQRVALGRAILREPRAFLFDEPLSSLDAQMRLQLRVEIQRLHQRLRTPMLFVTHDQSEALTLGDRVVVLNQGRIQQIATPEELYAKPANIFVASFIGSPGMNLFPGRIETRGDVARFISPALEFEMDAAQKTKLQSRNEVIAGIRPDRLHPFQDGNSRNNGTLRGKITAVEVHAGQTCLYLENRTVSFAVKTQDFSAKAGELTTWNFSSSNFAFFDFATGVLL